jgi:gamma-glutamyltranspeptidase/glutathione hydrolase
MAVTPAQMLDDAYLAARARLIDRSRAGSFGAGAPPSGGTVYLSAADENGMMVSFIQSNCRGFGSGIVVPGTGISLQNRGVGFSMDPGAVNVVRGGLRPFHTIIPAFLTRGGKPVMSFGVKGGDMQAQGHVQTLVRMLDYHQNPQAACDAPRWKVNASGGLDVEDSMAPALIADLVKMGHSLQNVSNSHMDFGSGQFIWRLSEDDNDVGYVAASDSRTDGQAVGF